MEAHLTRWALKSGTWHLDEDGQLVKDYAPDLVRRLVVEVIKKSVNVAAALSAAKVVAEYVAKPTPPKKILAPTVPVTVDWEAAQAAGHARRKPLPPMSREEADRLVAEAIARGKVTKLPPGYAHNAKLAK
jgi:hypothetical protein